MKNRILAAGLGCAVGILGVALVACSDGSSGSNPTSANLSSTFGATVNASSHTTTTTPSPQPSPSPQASPTAAITACAQLSAAAACSYMSPSGNTISGTCQVRKKDPSQLVCFPADDDDPGGIEEELMACLQKAVSDACSFVNDHGDTVDGACTAVPNHPEIVICRRASQSDPDDDGDDDGDHDSGGDPATIAACQGLTSGATCSITGPSGTMTGTCKACGQGGTLHCDLDNDGDSRGEGSRGDRSHGGSNDGNHKPSPGRGGHR